MIGWLQTGLAPRTVTSLLNTKEHDAAGQKA